MVKYIFFSFPVMLFYRNASLEQKGIRAPTAYKTGTTICGVIYKVSTYTKHKETSNLPT